MFLTFSKLVVSRGGGGGGGGGCAKQLKRKIV
jgi:hypothetical protein